MKTLKALRRFRWSDVPKRKRQMTYMTVGVGCATLTMENKFRECIDIVGNPAGVTSPHTLFWLRIAFGRMRSRWVGALTEVRVPVALRSSVYGSLAWLWGIDLSEVRYPLDAYTNYQELFSRKLLDGVRPIADVPQGLVSPVDGQVMKCGIISETNERVEQVKGATYSVKGFLGYDPVEFVKPNSVIQYVVLYLGPGDYHRIHSPCQLTFSKGRHFCGELLPVRSWLLERINDVLSVNERVVLHGEWRFGQMNLAAVGAANVGNIFLDFDSKLKTNRLRDIAVFCGGDISQKLYPQPIQLSPGADVGGFLLGSTVVLIFEAPASFRFEVAAGDTARVGQVLGRAA